MSGEAPFPAAIEDVKSAVRWIRAHAKQLNLDSDRFAAVGHSAGGHLVMCLGAMPEEAGFKGETPYPNVSSQVRAVVSMAGVSDMAKLPIRPGGRRSGGGFLAGPDETFEERAKKASPIHYLTKNAAKFLLIHGTDDAAAPFAQSTLVRGGVGEGRRASTRDVVVGGRTPQRTRAV